MKKISIGRIILSVLAMLLVAMGIFMLVTSYLTRRAFYHRLDAKLMDIPVDISKPGTFSGPFLNICRSKHGQVLYLQIPPNVLKRITLEKVPSDLQFDFLLTDPKKAL